MFDSVSFHWAIMNRRPLYFKDQEFRPFEVPIQTDIEAFIKLFLLDYNEKYQGNLYTYEDSRQSIVYWKPGLYRTITDIYKLVTQYVNFEKDPTTTPLLVYNTLVKLINESILCSFICSDIGQRVYTLSSFMSFPRGGKGNYLLSRPNDEYHFDFTELLAKYPEIKTDKDVDSDGKIDGHPHYGTGNIIEVYKILPKRKF